MSDEPLAAPTGSTETAAPPPTSVVEPLPVSPEPEPEYRFGAEYPELAGLTAKEVAGMFGVLKQAVGGVTSATPQAPTPTPAPTPPAPPVAPPNGTSNTDQLTQVIQQNAAIMYNDAKRTHADLFRRYEQEILATLQRMPLAQWTPAVIDNAVRFVKGSHFDELLAEHTRTLQSGMGSGMRSTGGGGTLSVPTPQRTPGEQGVERWQQRAQAAGITDDQVREFAAANDMTADEFWRQFGHGLISDSVAETSHRKAGSGS